VSLTEASLGILAPFGKHMGNDLLLPNER